MRLLRNGISAVFALLLASSEASATPSTHIWSPSTDAQAYGLFHLTTDVYVSSKGVDEQAGEARGDRPATVTNLGLTVGVLPYERLQLEIGFDQITGYSFAAKNDLDGSPFYFNAKLATPEGAFGAGTPALAIGGYMFGTKTGGEARAGRTAKPGTDYNIYYAKAAKTLGGAGRFSAGYYLGNKGLLVDENGNEAAGGLMLAWERTVNEVSDRLSLMIDYMGGDNSFGAVSYGFAWKFSPETSMILAYVDQLNDRLAFVEDWVTVQIDIDFDVLGKK